MFWTLQALWRFRGEILLGIQLVSAARRKARDVAREYIRRRVALRLRRSIALVTLQIALLLAAGALDRHFATLATRCLASAALWAVTLYNLFFLLHSAIPELLAVRRMLRSKTGYALKYVLQVSLVAELMQWNVLFLALCLLGALSSRTWLGAAFSYLAPWIDLLGR